jgi:hypothetical protein
VPRRRSRKLPNPIAPVANFVLRYSRVHILHSALKHGATRNDISHAVRYLIVQYEIGLSDVADRILVIGPKRDGMLVEILGVLGSDEALTIFHCMPLRRQWINVLKENR